MRTDGICNTKSRAKQTPITKIDLSTNGIWGESAIVGAATLQLSESYSAHPNKDIKGLFNALFPPLPAK